MSQTILKWKRHEYHIFYAQMKLRVGGINGNEPVDIMEGDEFEYDGSIVKYAGREFPQPGLRGAIGNGWATLDPDGEMPATFQSTRQVARAKSVNKDLSRVQRTAPQPVEMDHLDEETVLNVGDRRQAMDPTTGRGHLTKEDNRRRSDTGRVLDVRQSDYDEQDHTPIGRVKSAAKIKVDVLDPRNANKARELQMQSRDSGYGTFQDTRKKVVQREGVQITTNVGDVDRSVAIAESDEGTVVGRVRNTDGHNQSHEGIVVEDTSKRSQQAVSQSPRKIIKKSAPAPSNGQSSSGGKDNPKLRIAKKVYSEFPDDWNFYGKTEDKMARLQEVGATADLLDALYASESKSMKKALKQQYSDHFS